MPPRGLILRPCPDDIHEAENAAFARQEDRRLSGHQRKDGSQGTFAGDFFAALAEIVFARIALGLVDFRPSHGYWPGPDVETQYAYYSVRHTMLPTGSLIVRSDDRKSLRPGRPGFFVLITGDASEMRLIGGLSVEQARKVVGDHPEFLKYRDGWDRRRRVWPIPSQLLAPWPFSDATPSFD